jgi:hypothetical protein
MTVLNLVEKQLFSSGSHAIIFMVTIFSIFTSIGSLLASLIGTEFKCFSSNSQ